MNNIVEKGKSLILWEKYIEGDETIKHGTPAFVYSSLYDAIGTAEFFHSSVWGPAGWFKLIDGKYKPVDVSHFAVYNFPDKEIKED